MVDARDVERLQTIGNYVNLRIRGRYDPPRSTNNDIESQLDANRFLRIHRA